MKNKLLLLATLTLSLPSCETLTGLPVQGELGYYEKKPLPTPDSKFGYFVSKQTTPLQPADPTAPVSDK